MIYNDQAPFVATSQTSREAASMIEPTRGNIRDRVEAFIKSQGTFGAIQDEILTGMDIEGDTLRPRIRELEAAGKIEKTDRTRLTRKGRKAVVYQWVAA